MLHHLTHKRLEVLRLDERIACWRDLPDNPRAAESEPFI
jgi:hypothetical protein